MTFTQGLLLLAVALLALYGLFVGTLVLAGRHERIRAIAGYLHGGMTAWREEKRAVAATRRMAVDELHRQWEAGAVQILDVRERSEWEAGHIPGSVHVPYHDLDGVPDGIDPDHPAAVICASGQRAAVGASLLQRHGHRDAIHVVDGGVPRWQREGWEIEAGG